MIGSHQCPRVTKEIERQRRRYVLSSRNSDVKPNVVSAVEGKPTYGGNLLV
jgi:hypothetical protein